MLTFFVHIYLFTVLFIYLKKIVFSEGQSGQIHASQSKNRGSTMVSKQELVALGESGRWYWGGGELAPFCRTVELNEGG